MVGRKEKQGQAKSEVHTMHPPKVCPLLGKPCVKEGCMAWDSFNGQCRQFPQGRMVTT